MRTPSVGPPPSTTPSPSPTPIPTQTSAPAPTPTTTPSATNAAATTERSDRDTLVSVLSDRAHTIVANIDQQIQEFDSPQAQTTIKKLKTLRERFLSLFKEHIAAIEENNVLLAHERHSMINDILSELETVIREQYEKIRGHMSDRLRFKYIVAPEPGQDKEHDAAMAELLKLNESRDERLKTLVYPGPASPRVPAELYNGFFVTPTPSF
jgi:hypothetical protein